MKLRKIIRMNWAISGVVVLGLLCLVAVGDAKEGKGKDKSKPAKDTPQEEVVAVKEIKGEVACFVPRKEPIFIGIAYEPKKTDYYFILDEDLQIYKEGRIFTKENLLKKLQVGDTVKVTYEVRRIIEPEKEKKAEQEEKQEKTKRVAKMISFVKSPQKGLGSGKK